MKSFRFSDMNRESGKILETALMEPVALTKYGKERLVIIPADRYRRLLGEEPSNVFTIEDAPDAVHAELEAGLDAILNDEPSDA
jgi:PHD/YefM family antitoxin component YafN of YafNO toxin-antitoxin module